MFAWPPGFPRIPEEEWTKAPVAELAAKYDAVGRHGWYANLDPTTEALASILREGDVLIDYSGGTGLLADRLLVAMGDRRVGIVEVDSSPKFLAMALAKFRDEPRVAFRLVRYRKEERRLESLDETLAGRLGPADALVSANAIHLYHGLDETLASWRSALRPGAFVHVQSGNIRDPDAPAGTWIIDDTVAAVDMAAREIVRSTKKFGRFRPVLDDESRMRAHEAYRDKVFLAPRPLAYYLDAMVRAGLEVQRTDSRAIPAKADEWHQFLATYSDAVLGWVGGTERIDGRAAEKRDIDARHALMREALGVVVGGAAAFDAAWTYITARRP